MPITYPPGASANTYDVDVVVQDFMPAWVRDELGVDASTLSDGFILGRPTYTVSIAATRQVPNWPSLPADLTRYDFDQGVVYRLCAACIGRLKTLYAPGESTSDMRAGNYQWDQRRAEYLSDANAAWNRARTQLSLVPTTVIPVFQPYGRSKIDGYRSPDALNPSVLPFIRTLETP